MWMVRMALCKKHSSEQGSTQKNSILKRTTFRKSVLNSKYLPRTAKSLFSLINMLKSHSYDTELKTTFGEESHFESQ